MHSSDTLTMNERPLIPYGPFIDKELATQFLDTKGYRDKEQIMFALKEDIDNYWRLRKAGHRQGEKETYNFYSVGLDCLLATAHTNLPSSAFLDLAFQNPNLSDTTQEYLAGLCYRIHASGIPSTFFPIRSGGEALFLMRCLTANPNVTEHTITLLSSVPDMASMFADRLDKFPETVPALMDHLPVLEKASLIQTLFGLLSSTATSLEEKATVTEFAYSKWDYIEQNGRQFEQIFGKRLGDAAMIVHWIAASGVLAGDRLPSDVKGFFIVQAALE